MTPSAPDCPLQLSFAEVERGFAACGIKSLPEGVSELTRREMVFVMRLLEHGQHARAAEEAGYSKESAGAIASETLRKPKVFAFYRRCLDKVANEAANLVRTTFERYVIFHAKAMEAAQVRKEADAWLELERVEESGKNEKERVKKELERTRAQRDEIKYAREARQEAALLGALLGKLKIKIEGDVKVSVVTDDDRAHLMELEAKGVPVRMPELGARVAAPSGVAGGRN